MKEVALLALEDQRMRRFLVYSLSYCSLSPLLLNLVDSAPQFLSSHVHLLRSHVASRDLFALASAFFVLRVVL